MPTVTVASIIDRAAGLLFDPDSTRWTADEKLEYFNDGQHEAVALNPSCNAVDGVVQLNPGVRQTLPDTGLALIDIQGNMGFDGQTPGRGVIYVHRSAFDLATPNWRANTADATVQNYLYDERIPRSFEVWPPQPDPAGYVQLTYSQAPPRITDLTNDPVITLPDAYSTALVYYCLSRALARDGGTSSLGKAQYYHQLFQAIVTGRMELQTFMHQKPAKQRQS